MTIWGTAYFPSVLAASIYYSRQGMTRGDVLEKHRSGEIHIGKPELKTGERLTLVDGGTRYAIIEA